ncbi:hypothetical protein ACIQUL_34295 [Streptomyces sp. NPDC090303]|uniref:hypothetical protein n=1 Tax=Streptomyces sp. NPDC090303 TaxID=3365960 RepID=UPI003804F53B
MPLLKVSRLVDSLLGSNQFVDTILREQRNARPPVTAPAPAVLPQLVTRAAADQPATVPSGGGRKIYVLGHGRADDHDLVALPRNGRNIRFYCTSGYSLDMARGTRMILDDLEGRTINTPRTGEIVPNMTFEALTSGQETMARKMLQRNADLLQWVGKDLPGDSVLCTDTQGQNCARGEHDCAGILGTYATSDIDIIACRGGESENVRTDWGNGRLTSHELISSGAYKRSVTYSDMMERDAKNGVPYSGEFARTYDSLSEQDQGFVMLDDTDAQSWFFGREIWKNSQEFQDPAALLGGIGWMREEYPEEYIKLLRNDTFLRFALTADKVLAMFRVEQETSPVYGEVFTDMVEREDDARNLHDVLSGIQDSDDEFNNWMVWNEVWQKTSQFADKDLLSEFLEENIFADTESRQFAHMMKDVALWDALDQPAHVRIMLRNMYVTGQSDQIASAYEPYRGHDEYQYLKNDVVLAAFLASQTVDHEAGG